MLSSSSLVQKEVNVMEKFTRVTIRIPELILERLKADAENKKLSFNSYLSKHFYRIVVSEIDLKAIPSITISKSLLVELVSSSNEKQIAKFAIEEVETIKKLFKILGYDYNIRNLIKNYFVIMGEHWSWYRFSSYEQDKKCRLIFQTGLGKKWIKFLSMLVLTVMESLKIPVDDEYVKNDTLVVEFKMMQSSSL